MEEISSIYIAATAAKITASTNSFLLMKERGYSSDDISFCRINRYSDKVACLFDSGWLALKALYIMTSLNWSAYENEVYELNFFQRLRRSISVSQGGSKKLTDTEAINSLSSAYVTLETKLNLKSTGRSAICIKRAAIAGFDEMKYEIERFLEASKADFDLTYRTIVDPYDYLWIIIVSKTIEDNVAAITSIGETIEQKGFSDKLLASVFDFNDGNVAQYLIYNYKLDKFYPFVPTSEQQKRRNHGEELKIMSAIADELPFEKEMSKWYPIWNIPV